MIIYYLFLNFEILFLLILICLICVIGFIFLFLRNLDVFFMINLFFFIVDI